MASPMIQTMIVYRWPSTNTFAGIGDDDGTELEPRPVRDTTPTMIPAAAQVEATLNIPVDPPLKALISFPG